MIATNPRQSVAFPIVARINKGTPKQIMVRDGRKLEIQGKDLNSVFRVHFYPGTDDARAAFHLAHGHQLKKYSPDKFVIPEGYEVDRLRVIVPVRSVWDAWDYGNEAYSAGRRVALADDDHYILLRDPGTGEILVKDGEPYRKFTPGDVIAYEKGGKKYELKMKPHGRLRLVLADMIEQGQLVQFELKSTSFYDCQNIQRQLAGIQSIADTVNRGNAAGVPFVIYRMEQEVTWNKPDGSAQRVKKWFYNLQPDSEWVKAAFARMGKFALTGQVIAGALMPPEPAEISGPINPADEPIDEDDNLTMPEDVIEGAFQIDEEPEQPKAQPARKPAQTQAEQPAGDPTQPVKMVEPLSWACVDQAARHWEKTPAKAAQDIGKKGKQAGWGKSIPEADWNTFLYGAP